MSQLSEATVAQIRRALELWKAQFGRSPAFFADNFALNQISSDGADCVVLALELARLADDAAQACTFTAQEILNVPAEVEAKMAVFREIRAAANAPEIQAVMTACRERIRQTAEAFGAAEKIAPMLANERIGELIRTAEQEFGRLRVHQYAQGNGKRERFHLNGWLYGFRSMHELVCALARQPVDGLTLCVVLDPEVVEYSVFAWAVKVGATLTVLSEDNGLSHRAQKFIRRNPGRDFERRTSGRFYPYSIFEFKETSTASGHGRQTRIAGMFRNGKLGKKKPRAIEAHSIEMHKVRPLQDLEAEEITWLILVADLIHRKFWLGEAKEPGLSYTGEMVVAPDAVPAMLNQTGHGQALLEDPHKGAGIALIGAVGYEPLTLRELDPETIRRTAENGSSWEGPSDVGGRTGYNDWMVRRYEQRVNVQALAALPSGLLHLPDSSERVGASSFTTDGEITAGSTFLRADHHGFGAPVSYRPTCFDPRGLYGKKEEIEKERFFIARSNQAGVIQALADKEFAERAGEIVSWFQDRVLKNVGSLKRAIGEEKCVVSTLTTYPPAPGDSSFTNKARHADRNILRLWKIRDEKEPETNWGLCQILANLHCGIERGNDWKYRCVEDREHVGRCIAIFEPLDVRSLAFLAGVEVTGLPDVLQHWRNDRYCFGYIGNAILDLIDPVEMIKNPWHRLYFRVQMHFTRSTFKRWQQGHFRDSSDIQISIYPEVSQKQLFGIV